MQLSVSGVYNVPTYCVAGPHDDPDLGMVARNHEKMLDAHQLLMVEHGLNEWTTIQARSAKDGVVVSGTEGSVVVAVTALDPKYLSLVVRVVENVLGLASDFGVVEVEEGSDGGSPHAGSSRGASDGAARDGGVDI